MTAQFYYQGSLSRDGPTPQDLELTKTLDSYLHDVGLYESEEESALRVKVLEELSTMTRDWIRRVSLKKGIPANIVNEIGGKIYTFGSYRLGVHSSGADIDTLCIGPRHVDASDFFTDLYEALKAHPEITDLSKVEDSFVPVQKFEFSGIPIDLVYGKLKESRIPEDLTLLDDRVISSIQDDLASTRSVNGCRVTDEILNQVPKTDNFRVTLRAVKLFTKVNCVYGNAVGYVAGVSCAILVARICQLYPNAAPANLLLKFFQLYSTWSWPAPVLLKPLPNTSEGWNPLYNKRQGLEKMPIITPVSPNQNSTYNVTESTLHAMTQAFKRGHDIIQDVYSNKAPWADLFTNFNFFSQYKQFFRVDYISTTAEIHKTWGGFVQSRYRRFVGFLERNPDIQYAIPYPDSFSTGLRSKLEAKLKNNEKLTEEEEQQLETLPFQSSLFIGIVFTHIDANNLATPSVVAKNPDGSERVLNKKRTIDVRAPATQFLTLINAWVHKTEAMNLKIAVISQKKLPSCCWEETGHSPPKKKKKKKKKSAVSSLPTSTSTTKTSTPSGNDSPPDTHPKHINGDASNVNSVRKKRSSPDSDDSLTDSVPKRVKK